MTKTEKKRFIKELFASIQKKMVENIDKMPDTWDGIELREIATDMFAASSFLHNRLWRRPTNKAYRRRAKDYENEVIVRNL